MRPPFELGAPGKSSVRPSAEEVWCSLETQDLGAGACCHWRRVGLRVARTAVKKRLVAVLVLMLDLLVQDARIQDPASVAGVFTDSKKQQIQYAFYFTKVIYLSPSQLRG